MKVPYGFARCYQERCPKKESCLRWIVAQREDTEAISIPIINPRLIPEEAAQCTYFLTMQKQRVAWGVKHLFDEVPAKQLRPMKNRVMGFIGRTRYYRIYRMEQGLTPADQQFIADLFRQNGLSIEPVYDHFTEEYCWG